MTRMGRMTTDKNRGGGSGKQTVRSLVETWRAASPCPHVLANGTNAGGIQGLTGETRHATSLLSAGKGTRMMKKKMMIIVPLSPMGSSPISGEQMKTHIKKQRPAPVSPPPIADRPLFHVPPTPFPYEVLFPCVREEECCFMVQLRHDTDKNQVPSLHPSLI